MTNILEPIKCPLIDTYIHTHYKYEYKFVKVF